MQGRVKPANIIEIQHLYFVKHELKGVLKYLGVKIASNPPLVTENLATPSQI
jgi:hypothetical protein